MTTARPTWGEVFEAPPTATADDLLRMPDDGAKYELYEGVLVREMTFAGHGALCQRLGGELYLYARTSGYPNTIVQNTLFDLTLSSAPTRTMLAPDLAIMCSTTPLTWNTVPHDAPLLAVEVISDSQSLVELSLKAQHYLSAGVEEVWVVDHKARGVEVWNAQGHSVLGECQTLTSPLLPGFGVSVRFFVGRGDSNGVATVNCRRRETRTEVRPGFC